MNDLFFSRNVPASINNSEKAAWILPGEHNVFVRPGNASEGFWETQRADFLERHRVSACSWYSQASSAA